MTKYPQKPHRKKHQRKGKNIEHQHKNITGKTPSTKPTLIQTKHYHYHNNLNETFSKIIKKSQTEPFRFTTLNKNITASHLNLEPSLPSFPLLPFFCGPFPTVAMFVYQPEKDNFPLIFAILVDGHSTRTSNIQPKRQNQMAPKLCFLVYKRVTHSFS